MKKNLENFKKLVSDKKSGWLEKAIWREENEVWLDKSAKIAIRILREIRLQKSNGMTQKKLADALNVSAQYINKVVKGNENLTLETISKIEQVLGIALIEIPDFKTSISLEMNKIPSNFPLHSFNSVSFVKKTCVYDINSYNQTVDYEATGTYG